MTLTYYKSFSKVYYKIKKNRHKTISNRDKPNLEKKKSDNNLMKT